MPESVDRGIADRSGLMLADLIAAERVAGRILAEPGAGPVAFTLLTNWSFSPFREASEAARTVASRSR